jgi:hypothetical protein
MSSWRKDIQSVVKKCRILALYFFPGEGRGTVFTLTAALVVQFPYLQAD